MIHKKKLLEMIQSNGDYNTQKDAVKAYKAVMSAIENALLSSDGVKIPNVGILKKTLRKARKIKVPTLDEKVEMKKHDTITLDVDDLFKYRLNKNRKN